MRKIVALSQSCSVLRIQECGKRIRGSKASPPEKDDVDTTDNQQIIANW